MFDAQSFLDQQVTDANSTIQTPVPEGEFQAVIEKVDCRQWTSKKDPTQSGLALDIVYIVEDPVVKELLGRDKVTVKQGIMLDLTDAGGLDLGKGKNVGLGRLRESVDLNTPGQPFSFAMLPGRMNKILVKHRVDGDTIYAEVKGTARLS